MHRTIVIGDLHGCFDEALELLDRLAVTEHDRVIFAGDLVDRGPKPRECVELAMRHECTLGNHEEKQLPKFIRLPEHGAVVVHAGVMPGVAIESQDPYHLLHAQCIHPPERKSYWPSKAPSSHTFWTNHRRGSERVIFGHTVVDKPLVTAHAVGIDTGCCFGGPLTAVVLPGWQIVSVPSRQPKDSERGVKRYPIHGDVNAFS